MGVYIYTTAPKRKALVEVEDAVTCERKVIEVAIFCYAARMSWGEQSRHERLAIGSAISRFERTAVAPLAFGMYGDIDTKTIYWDNDHNDIVEAGGPLFYDSDVKSAHLRITKVLKLPSGWKAVSYKQQLRDTVMAGDMVTSKQSRGGGPFIEFSLYKNSPTHFVMVAQGGGSHQLNIENTDKDRLWAHWEGFRDNHFIKSAA
jgi:hypothetical protein